MFEKMDGMGDKGGGATAHIWAAFAYAYGVEGVKIP